MESSDIEIVTANVLEIIQCQFDQWYHKFIGKTFKSQIILLQKEFIEYLGEDGVILPDSAIAYYADDPLARQQDGDENLAEVNEGMPDAKIYVNKEGMVTCKHDFSDLENQLKCAIDEMGGEFMVKLNWSCPIDAVWVNGGSLKCQSIADIFLLLKSSDRVTFDLEHMFDLCTKSNSAASTSSLIGGIEAKGTEPLLEKSATGQGILPSLSPSSIRPTLVIRKWANLQPSMEFRIFIHGNEICGISQRDCCTYYDFLDEALLDKLQSLIEKFFRTHVQSVFSLQNYAMDVYIDKKDRVWIVDFNPFGLPTIALLFEWEELLLISSEIRRHQSLHVEQNSRSSNSSSCSSSSSSSSSSRGSRRRSRCRRSIGGFGVFRRQNGIDSDTRLRLRLCKVVWGGYQRRGRGRGGLLLLLQIKLHRQC